MEEFWKGIVDFFKNAGWNILYGVIILVVGLIIVKLVKAVLKRILRRAHRDEAMASFVVSLVNIVLEIVVLITALATMGVNTASIIAVIGTCGVAIGLALKDSLGNIASGIMIIFNKPFKKDDYVQIDGKEGRITQINLFNTTLLTDDATLIIVPNSEAVNNPIINYEACKNRRVVVDVAVDKGSDIQQVRDILSEVADNEHLLAQDEDYSIVVNGQDTNCVKMQLKCYTATADYWTVKYRLTESVYTAMKNNGFLTPNMQIDVHEGKRPEPVLLTGKSRKAYAESEAEK